MKVETTTGPVADLSDVAQLPIIPAPGEASTELPKQDFIPQDLTGAPSPPVPGSTVNAPGDSRPSLDVAIENLANLQKHVSPFCGRLRAWDTRGLSSELSVAFQGSVEDLSEAFVRLGTQLDRLKAMGFVAKTTPITRLRAKLQVGARVQLTAKAHDEFSQLFDDAVLGSLEVAQLRNQHAFLKSVDGTALGAVKLSCIELVE